MGIAFAGCNINDGKSFFANKDKTKPISFKDRLDNVARVFSIDKLDKVHELPTVPEGKQVIGVVTEDRSIESVSQEVIYHIAKPLIKRHVDKYMPAYSNFSIDKIDFILFKGGELLLALAIVSDSDSTPRQVYVKPVIEGHCILIPRQAPTYTCSVTSCPSSCKITGTYDPDTREFQIWCQCQSSGYDKDEGCEKNVS